MTLYESKPTQVDAIQFVDEDFVKYQEFTANRVRINPGNGALELLAGKDGAQGWVPVPLGHWIVHMPGDLDDFWPVENDYFAGKYEAVVPLCPHGKPTNEWQFCCDYEP